mgnify:CR=1 FL=1
MERKGNMRAVLDGAKVISRASLHRALAQALQLPGWYGKNLDALHDCLTARAEPTELVILAPQALEQTLGSYAAAFYRVLEDSAAENPAFRFSKEA